MDIKDLNLSFLKKLKKLNNSTKIETRKKVVAFDIGSSNIKIVQGMYFKNKLSINKCIEVPTPDDCVDDGDIVNNKKLLSTVQYILEENKISGEYEKEAIKTPVFINAFNIIHGVYKGNQVMDISNNLSFPRGSRVAMAASFTYTGAIEPKISVVNGKIISKPVIYKVNKSTKQLEKVVEFTNIDSTSIRAGLSSGDTVYILYNIKLTDNITEKGSACTSILEVNSNKFPATVKISDESLPDLY